MRSFVVATARCLAVEVLKIRRTLALVLVVVLPSVPGALTALRTIHNPEVEVPTTVNPRSWFLYDALSIWCMLLLPLFVALECTLTAGIEHQSQGWRRLCSLPVPRSSVYLGKFLMNLALVAIGFGVFLSAVFVAMRSASWARPDAQLGGAFPWAYGLRLAAMTFAASLLLLAIHSYVALRWSSYSLNIGLAIVGVVGIATVADSRLMRIYPWALPSAVLNLASGHAPAGNATDHLFQAERAILLGIACAAVVLVGGGWDLVRRDVP